METKHKDKLRSVVKAMRKLPVWAVVYEESYGYSGDSFKNCARLTLKEARLFKRKLRSRMSIAKETIVLDIQDDLW